ncbi:uncharacterized protein LOC141850763 [Brevipalpus obovatus]|uniref:uncharacterized protein LOC141850763 n=1 Tax=Brevipalpus obovatus TaxID=246614 RepID=UPI003D9E9EFE
MAPSKTESVIIPSEKLQDVKKESIPQMRTKIDPIKDSLTELRSMIEADDFLKKFDLDDDEFLIRFLKVRDFDTKETRILLKNYVKMIHEKPEYFQWDIDIEEILKGFVYHLSPGKHREGGPITEIRANAWNPEEKSIQMLIKFILIELEAGCLDPAAQEIGFHTIFNVSDLSLHQIYSLGIRNSKFVADFSERAFPFRMRGVHIMFQNRYINLAYNLIKPFMSQQLRDMVHFHGQDLAKLHEYCPPESIHTDFGGTLDEEQIVLCLCLCLCPTMTIDKDCSIDVVVGDKVCASPPLKPSIGGSSKVCSKYPPLIEDKLAQFRKRMEKNSLLKQYNCDDEMLVKFLRARSYDVKKGCEVLFCYVSLIQSKPELFSFELDLRKAMEQGIYSISNGRSCDGAAIILIKVRNWNPKVIDVFEMLKLAVIECETMIMNEDIQEKGFHTVIDASGLSLYQIYQFGLWNAKLLSDLSDRALPMLIKKVHVVFQNYLVDMAYNMFKPFLSEEFKQRIVFHGRNLPQLHECCPPNALPSDFGGNLQYGLIIDKKIDNFHFLRPTLLKTWGKFAAIK